MANTLTDWLAGWLACVACAHDVVEVDSIIIKLETLENEKNKLKDELKSFEHVFLKKKKIAEDEINKISQEKEIIDKTINIIKSLKNF